MAEQTGLKQGEEPVYFAMNMPHWFMKKSSEEKSEIVIDIAKKLNEIPAATDEEIKCLIHV
jgi:hypothetical protein